MPRAYDGANPLSITFYLSTDRFGLSYPFGEGHTFAGVNCVVDWMHEQDVVPVRAS
jgi:hypothetical protein